jgi:hypothetical protein
MSEKKKTEPGPAQPPFTQNDVGLTVHILFWRPSNVNPYTVGTPAGGPGVWDTLDGRIVSVGAYVCVELWNNTASIWYGNSDGIDAPAGSGLRFVKHDELFRSRESAIDASKTRKIP